MVAAAVAAYLGIAFTLRAVMISGMVRLKIIRPKELLTLLWWPASDELIGRWGWQALRRFRRGACAARLQHFARRRTRLIRRTFAAATFRLELPQ